MPKLEVLNKVGYGNSTVVKIMLYNTAICNMAIFSDTAKKRFTNLRFRSVSNGAHFIHALDCPHRLQRLSCVMPNSIFKRIGLRALRGRYAKGREGMSLRLGTSNP